MDLKRKRLMEPRVDTNLSIVIVEEPCLSRNVMAKALGVWGYPCAIAEDEDAAWKAVMTAQAPVLVLADWHADFMGCDEFFWKVRATPSLQDVYLMGGIPRGAVGAIRQCMASGANDFVYRPYDLDEMRVRLHVACKVMGLDPDGFIFPD